MTTAAEVAAEVVANESAAVVAEVAAENAVIAAETAVAMANVQTAQVVVAAAEEVREVKHDVEKNEEDVAWLREKTASLETANLATLEKVSSLEAALVEIRSMLTASAASPSPIPAPEPIPGNLPLTEVSQSESVVAQPVAEASPAAPRKKPLRRL